MREALPKVVALGGGHGLSASLRALRQVTDQLTAVVTVADDGGSSGRLRTELGGLPPGDLRMALAALCGDDTRGRHWSELIQTRYVSAGPLNGHAVGNLLLEAMWQQVDSVRGLDLLANLIGVQGRVLPMSTEPLDIEASVIGLDPLAPDETTLLRGQHKVATTGATVCKIRLDPPDPPACQQAVDAVNDADFVILGPGSWFTSVLPHLLVPELANAIFTTRAKRVLTLNLAPADETEGFSAARHLEILAEHAPLLRFDYVIADESFAANDAHLGAFTESLGARLVIDDVRLHDGTARHDTLRLASVYRELMELR